MTLHEHGFDGSSVTTSAQLGVPNATTQVDRGVVISMDLKTADLATKRLLVRSIAAVGIVTHTALLGRIRTDDRGCHDPTFLTIPSDLLRQLPDSSARIEQCLPLVEWRPAASVLKGVCERADHEACWAAPACKRRSHIVGRAPGTPEPGH